MTTAELYDALKDGVNAIDFEPPVSVAYCKAVYDAIRARCPALARLEVYHTGTEVVVAAWDSGQNGPIHGTLRLPCV